MSKVINSFLTRILIAKETTQGTPEGTFDYLWPSGESDSLTLGETPFDEVALRGVRGQLSTGFRQLQNLPGGALGEAPLQLLPDAESIRDIFLSHFQKVTKTGSVAPYTYTYTPQTAGIEDGSFTTLTICKDTGIADACHIYAGCLANTLTLGWEQGGVLKWTPEFTGMSSDVVGSTPAALSLGTGGFLQAPNINVTYNGGTVYPTAFEFVSNNNCPDRQSGNARGRVGHILGDWTGEFSLSCWRDDDFYTNFVAPFANNAVGTVVITATMDTAYGTTAGTSPVTLTMTLYVRVNEAPDLAVTSGEMIETVNFKVVVDTLPTIAITQSV